MMLIAAIKLHIIMYDIPIYNLKLRIDFRLILRNTQNMRKQSSILAIYGFYLLHDAKILYNFNEIVHWDE